MRITFLTLSIFLLSFLVAKNPTTSQNPNLVSIDEIQYYSEFEMQLRYLNSCSKLMLADVLLVSNKLAVDKQQGLLPSGSWDDIKILIDKDNEPDSTTNEDYK